MTDAFAPERSLWVQIPWIESRLLSWIPGLAWARRWAVVDVSGASIALAARPGAEPSVLHICTPGTRAMLRELRGGPAEVVVSIPVRRGDTYAEPGRPLVFRVANSTLGRQLVALVTAVSVTVPLRVIERERLQS
jgi:hypothetical protein